ncbi:MAG: RNA chaperone Hfq [Leptospiraceae bacterium]
MASSILSAMSARQHRSDQDQIIEKAISRASRLTLYLKNGVPVRGKVLAHDSHTVYVVTDKSPTLVFKHSISSVFPVRHPIPGR